MADMYSVLLEQYIVQITAISVGPNLSYEPLINGNGIFSRYSLMGVIVRFCMVNMTVALIF